jgi:hypothetical protein
MGGVTFDTGALIGLERSRIRALHAVALADAERRSITVPSVVIAEWWRGAGGVRGRMRRAFRVDPVEEAVARIPTSASCGVGWRRIPTTRWPSRTPS